MVVELRDKLAAMEGPGPEPSSTATGGENDVVFALTNLGYDRSVAEKAFESIQHDRGHDGFESVLRASLHWLRNPKARVTRASE
jgi:Holliday junction resolvasome RuvABC DNA-binding subunit